MAKSGAIHRIMAFLKHRLTAWNTTGEGIHSPYLFELVRFILRDENAYYCFADIERRERVAVGVCRIRLGCGGLRFAGSPGR